MADRDLTKTYSRAQFVDKLRRLADAIETQRAFSIQVAGERLRIPASAVSCNLRPYIFGSFIGPIICGLKSDKPKTLIFRDILKRLTNSRFLVLQIYGTNSNEMK